MKLTFIEWLTSLNEKHYRISPNCFMVFVYDEITRDIKQILI